MTLRSNSPETKVRMSDLGDQYKAIAENLQVTWKAALENARFIGGEEVREFEREFGDFLGAQFVAGVGNGTDALEIILQAMNFGPGSRVLVQANSFVASAEAVLNVGLELGLFDVKRDFSVDLDDLERELQAGAAAIVVVHLYGHPQPMDDILGLARHYNVKVIEDCAQAHGTETGGIRVGTLGDASAFSFFPGKNLGAFGDAGAVATNDQKLFEMVRRISNHGRLSKYDHKVRGRNSRLDSLQASVLRLKLPLLPEWNQTRQRNAERYNANLSHCPEVVLPPKAQGSTYHHYVIQVENRDELQHHLKLHGIETGIHYPTSIGQLSYLRNFGYFCPNADYLAARILSLPVGEHIGSEEVDFVSAAIRSFSSPNRS